MTLVDKVKMSVIEHICNGKKFTAHDITKDIRAKVGASVEVKHTEVNELITDFYASGDMPTIYTRKSEKVDGDKSAWVYQERDTPSSAPSGVANAISSGVNALTNMSGDLLNNGQPAATKTFVPKSLFGDTRADLGLPPKKSRGVVKDGDDDDAPLVVPPMTPQAHVDVMDEADLSDKAKEKLASIRAHYAGNKSSQES